MSGFFAIPDTPGRAVARPPATPSTVANDRWFPDIDLAGLRDAMRLDGTVTDERLRLATLDALASVNDELATWQAAQVAAGHADLASVPAPHVDGVSVHVVRYRRAIYHRVRADVLEQYRGYDTTKAGANHASDIADAVSEARRNVRWAINAIRGIPLSTVELI